MTEERKSIYIETTIPSYATARSSSDPVVAGRQILTKFFWENERYKYDLYVSRYVVEECSRGSPERAKLRLDFIAEIKRLPVDKKLEGLANIYQKILNIPEDAKTDAYHLASCVLGNIDYLLTWNCRHLGLVAYEKMRYYNNEQGLWTPYLVTPEHFTSI